jgi:mono/diheme cytochrome c family protein
MRTLTLRRPLSVLILAIGGCLMSPALAGAQSADTTALTSLSGVYTPEQVTKGKDIAAAACLSCHKPAEHSGQRFWDTLVNRSVWDFFSYLKKDMPQDNPGSLGDEDYAAVVSYIFSLNSMPSGAKPLPTDSVSLSKIKVVAPAPSAPTSTTRTTSKGPGK